MTEKEQKPNQSKQVQNATKAMQQQMKQEQARQVQQPNQQQAAKQTQQQNLARQQQVAQQQAQKQAKPAQQQNQATQAQQQQARQAQQQNQARQQQARQAQQQRVVQPKPVQPVATPPPAPKKRRLNGLFWLTVILPTLLSAVYFSVFASNVFISESSFVVRSPNSQSSLSAVGALLQNVGFSRSQDDSYTVQEYITSRNALKQLEKELPVRAYYEERGDVLARFNSFGLSNSKEQFYQYFKKKETVNLDSVSGISTLQIRAFNAEDAQKINIELLKQGETLINRLNSRARKDTVKYAQQAVDEARKRVSETAEALSKYRVKNNIFDVQSQSEVKQNLISNLQSELIRVQTQLDQIQAISPDNPQVKALKTRQKSIKEEMRKQEKTVLGRGNSIANQTAEYQRLLLDDNLAQQQLTSAMTSLQNTKDQTDRQQLYLEVIAEPSKPDFAAEPNRWYNILATLIIGLIVYGIFSLLLASVREHKN